MAMNTLTRVALVALSAIGGLAGTGTTVAAQQNALDEYVRLGLRLNPAIRQQGLAVRQSEAVVREALGNFLPTATLNARYTDVSGQVVNLGELINPAFAALNGLLGSPSFPTDIDLRLPLRQETAVRVTQPIFRSEIAAGYRAASAARDAQEATFGAAERALASEIRLAYVNHAKAVKLAELRRATREVLVEQARVMARLVDAGRATPDARSRASAELAEAEQRSAEAEQLALASGQAFNLLLGRELDAPVDLVDPGTLGLDALPSLDETLRSGLGRREELRALEAGGRAALAQQAIASAGYLPNLAVAVDYGIQGNDYRFTQETDFALVSVVASWNLFNGGRDRARVEQARLDAARITLRGDEVRRGVELQIRTAWQAAAVARQAIETAEVQREAAERTWQLVRRRAEEGLASALELSEARAGRTAAQINALFTTYDFYLRRVELDRAAALYPRISP